MKSFLSFLFLSSYVLISMDNKRYSGNLSQYLRFVLPFYIVVILCGCMYSGRYFALNTSGYNNRLGTWGHPLDDSSYVYGRFLQDGKSLGLLLSVCMTDLSTGGHQYLPLTVYTPYSIGLFKIKPSTYKVVGYVFRPDRWSAPREWDPSKKYAGVLPSSVFSGEFTAEKRTAYYIGDFFGTVVPIDYSKSFWEGETFTFSGMINVWEDNYVDTTAEFKMTYQHFKDIRTVTIADY